MNDIDELAYQISSLRKSTWVDLQGLTQFAIIALGNDGPCISITLLGHGSYNHVYKLIFADGRSVAAAVSKADEEDFCASAKENEIAAMRFVRTSGLYDGIPVPEIYYWDLTFSNPARAPTVLMEVIQGVSFHDKEDERGLRGLDALNTEQQMALVKRLARLKATLSKPVPFNMIGGLVKGDFTEGFSAGRIFTMTGTDLGGPYKSIAELWRAVLKREVAHALDKWDGLETDELSQSISEPEATPQQFSTILQLLSAMIPHFIPLQAYSTLVLHHPDIALRNILFDPNDPSRITGLLDWGGAHVLPLMFTAVFPDDLNSEADDPFTRPDDCDEAWRSVPHDWTSIGDKTKWPVVFRRAGEPVDLSVRARAMVRRYYLRQYFSACFAEYLADELGDRDLAHGTLFLDAPYYLKFHEVVCGGWTSWTDHADWIKETYWRIRLVNPREGMLITGPNVYRGSVEMLCRDLGLLETEGATDNINYKEDSD